MSITDIAAARTAQAPAPAFGTRRAPPRPPQPRTFSPARGSLFPVSRRVRIPAWPKIHIPAWPKVRISAWPNGRALLASLRKLLLRTLHFLAVGTATAVRRSETWSHDAAIRALLRSNASGTFVRLLAYLGALAALAFAAAHLGRPTPAAIEVDVTPPVEWIHVAKPFPAFSLPMQELSDSGFDYAMRRHISGGGRKDILTWGDMAGPAPHMVVEVYRAAAERSRFDNPERELAARLDGMAVTGLKRAGSMETKFGAVSLLEFSATPGRQCLGFVRAYKNPALQILGWHCTGGAAPVERDLAACALDRLTLLAASSDPIVRELFGRAELRRNFCGQRSHLLTPTPKLGPSAPPSEPKPRGRVASR